MTRREPFTDVAAVADVSDGELLGVTLPDGVPVCLYATAFEVDSKWIVEAAARRQKWIDQAQSLNIYMAGASGKKLDDTYKLAWLRGLKTTYYLRTTSATYSEKSTVAPGALNAVAMGASSSHAAAAQAMAEPASDIKFCAIDDPDCEACQ